MQNFKIEDKKTGKEYWISRSLAVLGIVIVEEEPNGPRDEFVTSKPGTFYWRHNPEYTRKRYILINKRGAGTPNYQHCWNIPCGYLDFDETTREATSREVLEECGIYIAPTQWRLYEINDVVEDGDQKQNVTIRYMVNLTMAEYKEAEGKGAKMKHGGEYNEVEGVELMEINEKNINKKDWAFNHKELVTKFFVNF